MRAVDPQHPPRPVSAERLRQINDRMQARFNDDLIDMLNPDPAYGLHAMVQTGKAAAQILSPVLALEGGEAAGGLQLAKLARSGLRAFGADTIEALSSGAARARGAVSGLAKMSEDDAAQLGKSASQFVRDLGKDVTKSSVVDVLKTAGTAGIGWMAARFFGAHHAEQSKP